MGLMELGDDNSTPQQQRLAILLGSYMRTGQFSTRLNYTFSELCAEGAKLKNNKTGQIEEVACDNVIMCRGYHGQPKLFEQISQIVPETYLVGMRKCVCAATTSV